MMLPRGSDVCWKRPETQLYVANLQIINTMNNVRPNHYSVRCVHRVRFLAQPYHYWYYLCGWFSLVLDICLQELQRFSYVY